MPPNVWLGTQDARSSAEAFRGELEAMRAREQAQSALVSAELRWVPLAYCMLLSCCVHARYGSVPQACFLEAYCMQVLLQPECKAPCWRLL